MSDRLVTVATFQNPIHAQLAKVHLDLADIECFLVDEEVISMNWFYSTALGGVKVQVRESDYEEAVEALRSSETPEPPTEEAAESDDTVPDVACPKCSSSSVSRERFSRKAAFISMLIARFPLPWPRRRLVCLDCGHEWKP